MGKLRKTKPFLFSYYHDGGNWSVTIHAYDWQDAEARAKKLGNLKLDGEIVSELPARCGILANIVCRVRNAFC